MRSYAAAFAWELRQRHRWGLLALGGYLLVLIAMRLLVLAPGERMRFEDARTFAFFVVVPLTSVFMYFLAVFSFGLAGDLAARQSMYPARMFTLPVTTSALVRWPMLYGTVAMALLWFTMRLLAIWSEGMDVPLIWPALLAASLLAWTQALTWTAYPLRGLRVLVTVLWLTSIDAIVMIALELKASEPVMLAILAPHVPLAYLAACAAVARARRGDVADWRWILAPFERAFPRRRAPFRSPAGAQLWFEWRRHGRALPALVAIVLPFELALLFPFAEVPVIVFEVLLGTLLTPPFLATFIGATVGRQTNESYGITPFTATRPLTDAALVAAKLKMAIRSTLVSWLLVIPAIPLALRWSGASAIAMDWMRELDHAVGTPRAIVLTALILALLMLSTWKQLVQSLYVGMSGREWAVKGSVFAALVLLGILVPLVHWIFSSNLLLAWLWNAFPWIAAVLICVKLATAISIATRLYDARLLDERTLLAGAACWSLAVFALYALLRWLTPEVLFRGYFLAIFAILLVPLARLSAAPLAFSWNRHR